MYLKQSEGWYSEHELNWLRDRVRENAKFGPVLEVGCYRGLSTSGILEGLTDEQRVFVVDDFRGVQPNYDFKGAELRDKFLENMKLVGGLHKVVLLEGTSTEVLPRLHAQFSLCHVDADHGESTEVELREAWRLLRPGGVLVMDDVNLITNGVNMDLVGRTAKKLFGGFEQIDIKVGYVRKPA